MCIRDRLKAILETPMLDPLQELGRRAFLFSTFTGLAYVDIMLLHPHHIGTTADGRRYIRINRKKTNVEAFIPLHPIAEQILSLYTKEKSRGDYKIFPDTMSDWKLLSHLKAVGLACGIRTPLTWHCARHTFATLAIEYGMPIDIIAKILGHTNTNMTRRYAKISEANISREMKKIGEMLSL